MKVLVSVFNNLYTDQRVEKVCQTLKQNNYEIELIGNNWGGTPKMSRDYSYYRIPIKSKILRYAYIEFQWKLYQQLLKRADKNTILLANDLDTLLPNYLVSKKLMIPLVYDSHEIFTEMPSLTGRWTQKVWRLLESQLVPKVQYMMTASKSYSTWYEKKYQIRKPITIQNFPRKAVGNFDHSDNNPKIIMYQGALNPFRGLDYLIPVMKDIPNAVLWIAGRGPHEQILRKLAEQHQVGEKVIFLGQKTPVELREITRRVDVGVSIEESRGLSYYYSMPNKISDYIQARVPIVVSDFPEMRSIIKNYGVGETIVDYSELATKIKQVLNKGRETFREQLEVAAADLCWENEEQKILNLFERVKSKNY